MRLCSAIWAATGLRGCSSGCPSPRRLERTSHIGNVSVLRRGQIRNWRQPNHPCSLRHGPAHPNDSAKRDLRSSHGGRHCVYQEGRTDQTAVYSNNRIAFTHASLVTWHKLSDMSFVGIVQPYVDNSRLLQLAGQSVPLKQINHLIYGWVRRKTPRNGQHHHLRIGQRNGRTKSVENTVKLKAGSEILPVDHRTDPDHRL
jgi:hypothetical protein